MNPIDELLTRGVDTIYPSKEEIEKKLNSGKKLKVYQGFDPTSPELHIGHMIGLRKLKQWHNLGHQVIFLIGDFTGMVGDPTGKLSARRKLSHEQTLENAKNWKKQAGRILDFEGKNPVEIRFNGEWLGKISAIEFLRIAGNLTFSQVVERDMFQERLKQGQDIYANEFMYPLMQAYDSVAMNVDVEIGGTDQMFNMLMGRKLMRQVLHKDKFVMTLPLLTDSDGKKIGKTEGNVIGLTDKPEDLFGKIMGLSDDVIVKGMEYLTDIPMDEVKTIEAELKAGENPVKYKKKLAFEIVKQLNSEEAAKQAQNHFERTVQQKEMPEEVPFINLPPSLASGATIADVLTGLELTNSKSEAKRLIEQGGVSIDNEIIIDPNAAFESKDEVLIKVGKRKFVKVK